MNEWNPPVHQATTGSRCPWCGNTPGLWQVHGAGICTQLQAEKVTERYIGVTPDQVRQIVREELARALRGQVEREP